MITKSLETPLTKKSEDEELLNLLVIAGLSHPQARVYLELVKRKESTAGALCKATGIKDSRIYTILGELEQYGLLVVQTTSPKLYRILSVMEGLQNLLGELESEYKFRKNAIKELNLRLTPLFDSIDIPSVIAYIIKGRENVLNKLHAELPKVSEEIIFRIPTVELLMEFKQELCELKERGIKLNIGVYQKGMTTDIINEFPFYICLTECACFYLMIDKDYLLSVSNWDLKRAYAIWTSDTSLISMMSSYSRKDTFNS
ncbi:MAG: TrmB family transcriptional regulator [Promethearchaeota archaeon]